MREINEAADVPQTWEEVDAIMSREFSFLEMEYGVSITGDYPLMKYLQQLEDLQYFKQKEQEQLNKHNGNR